MLYWLFLNTPAPVPDSTVPDALVSPGIWGFLVTAGVAIASILLIIDMARRVRRVRYREEIRERLAAEEAAAAGAPSPDDSSST